MASTATLTVPLIGWSNSYHSGARPAASRLVQQLPQILFGLACFLLILTVSWSAMPLQSSAVFGVDRQDEAGDGQDEDILILGAGGAVWSNGSRALTAKGGTLSWACALSDGSLSLVDEDTSTILRWRALGGRPRSLSLSRLRRPVQCMQRGALLYVACFGLEEQLGRSGIAIIDIQSWAVQTSTLIRTLHPSPSPSPSPLPFTLTLTLTHHHAVLKAQPSTITLTCRPHPRPHPHPHPSPHPSPHPHPHPHPSPSPSP